MFTMKSVLLAFSLVGAAAAQGIVVDGPPSMIPSSSVYPSGQTSPADNHASATSSYTSSSAYSQATPPPSTDGGLSYMPYQSFKDGGYKSMDCGYGYSKSSDGSCKSMSWVSSS